MPVPNSSSGTGGSCAPCAPGSAGSSIRDIRRKVEGQDALEEAFALPLSRATQIRSQQ